MRTFIYIIIFIEIMSVNRGEVRKAMKRLHGIHTPHRKNTAEMSPVRIPIPKSVLIPMALHIGAPALPVVQPGDPVKVGQLIAEANGYMSSPIYSSVSGTVKKIDRIQMSGGQFVSAVVIESDGEQAVSNTVVPPAVTDLQSFLKAVRESGVVGLGGAGFPTAVKLDVKDLSRIEAVIVNGAECEPYITSDTYTMLERTDAVWDGIQLIKEHLKAKRIIIGIEDNKPKCIKKFQELCTGEPGVEVNALPAVYPQGGEKVLIYNTIGRMVPEGKLPIDAGAIVINCTTLAAISKYIRTGMPLVEKCITVDGSAVKNPQNVIAPIGTPIGDIFEFCGGFQREPKKVLYGGPMMGIAVPSLQVPVLKSTNALLAFDEKDGMPAPSTACIKCGRCIAHCPLNLMPVEIERAYKLHDCEALEKFKVNICMECGCCCYVCPAKRPLVQSNKLAKAMLRSFQAERKAALEKAEAKKVHKEEVRQS